MITLSTGLLFIPLLQILLTSSCALMFSSACSTYGYYGQLAATILAGIFIIVMALLFSAVFYNSAQLTADLFASSTGRHSIVLLGLQVILVIHQGYNPFDPLLRIVVTALCGVAWLVAMVYFMPYHAHVMNRAWIAGAMVFLSGVICLAVNQFYSKGDAALLFYLLIPASIGCGMALADWRANWILCCAPDRLNTPFEVDVKARYMVNEALNGHPFFISEHFRVESARGGAAHARALINSGSDPHSGAAATAVASATAPQLEHGGLLGRITHEKVAAILDLFRNATVRFERNAFAHLFASRAYAFVAGNRHLQMSHLLQASRCSPSLDVAFTIFQTRRVLENDAIQKRGGGVVVSAMSRVAFEKHAADARREVQRAAAKQLSFWAELCEPVPDITRLFHIAADTQRSVNAAEDNFKALFSLSPQALAQMRMYASFNLHVAGNAEKASVLLGEAERIEDSRSREHRSEAGAQLDLLAESPLDVWGESTAIITISSNIRDLGVVQSLNAAACRLLGYSRIQLERRSAFALMPPVLDRLHEESLRSYAKSGESELGVVDYTRVTLITCV